MCTVCGCGRSQGASQHAHHQHGHDHAHPHAHHHDHDDHHHDGAAALDRPAGAIDFGGGIAGVHVPGLSQARIVRIEQDILGENDRHAAANRARLEADGVLALNLMSSPGSGKTTLLVRTIEHFLARLPVGVIEGDQRTQFDADRVRATGAPAIQVNTGKGCHLDAHMIDHALADLSPARGTLLFIENVGNLVCPAAFDLGEAARVVMLSVTEGDDKPLKYPDMFHTADLVLLTKIDLLPYVPFDVERCRGFARRVNPAAGWLPVSALTGEGLDAWFAWIDERRRAVVAATRPTTTDTAEADV